MNETYTDEEQFEEENFSDELAADLYSIFQRENGSPDAFNQMSQYIWASFLPKKEEKVPWLDAWVELFPKGVKSGGKLLRSDRKICLEKMKKFLKDYDFPKEVIMGATKDYLSERAEEDYMYTKCATYLIDKKGEGSELAALCSNYEPNKKSKYYVKTGLI